MLIYKTKDKINNTKDLRRVSRELKDLEKKITLFNVKLVKKIINNCKENIDLIGFHGQTIFHSPKDKISKQLGDAKLLSALGFWFGWISIPFILIFSSLTALGFSLPSLIKKSKNLSTEIPFGPHMVIGCILYVVLIDEIFKFLI